MSTGTQESTERLFGKGVVYALRTQSPTPQLYCTVQNCQPPVERCGLLLAKHEEAFIGKISFGGQWDSSIRLKRI
jgi:hypothetical protein